ncbi:uncharacterized protein LOC111621527 [Centruroides sculpturatus]|uniref:uncharacterized protein LOC111621527 n=1 Tax=Centruroides sculpturatus TaxID=218467 RepID=UPI000C6D2A97|nr:uncharacterized protein LOC111621527 [Centruroides sculpturatus]
MQLIGGEKGELKHGDTRNLTLMYPNLYLHDRKGSCQVVISSERDKIEYTINFDTLLYHYLANEELKECSSVDENPLNDCLPAICLIKYSGKRNFFNRTTRRCQKVAECFPDEEGDLPDIVYIPESNTCRKLTRELTENDFMWSKEGKKGTSLSKTSDYPTYVNCQNGKADPFSELCKCNPGWTSAPCDITSFNP